MEYASATTKENTRFALNPHRRVDQATRCSATATHAPATSTASTQFARGCSVLRRENVIPAKLSSETVILVIAVRPDVCSAHGKLVHANRGKRSKKIVTHALATQRENLHFVL